MDAQFAPRIAPGKKVILVTCQAAPEKRMSELALSWMKQICQWMGMKIAGTLVVTGVADPGEVNSKPAVLRRARRLLARALQLRS
jgi:FMN-dependent NADH-azoreductase